MLEIFASSIASGLNISAIGATIVFAFSVVQFLSVRKRESQEREFQNYHALIKELVAPDEKGQVFMDRQIAIAFELRHFPRYYECTERILGGLKQSWQQPQSSRLIEEISLTLAYIAKKKRWEGWL